MPFKFEKTAIADVILIIPRSFEDDRGFFMESYKASEFKANGITEDFLQDNHSFSTKNVIRGLHFQTAPKPQGKLVRCVAGRIFDVAVDIRKDSETFGKWVAAELSSENKQMLYLPAGFAHGFAVLSETAEVLYKTTNEYSAPNEGSILWNDPDIGIAWPVKEPVLSEKDKAAKTLKENISNQTSDI